VVPVRGVTYKLHRVHSYTSCAIFDSQIPGSVEIGDDSISYLLVLGTGVYKELRKPSGGFYSVRSGNYSGVSYRSNLLLDRL
jgi:hypothetical protein